MQRAVGRFTTQRKCSVTGRVSTNAVSSAVSVGCQDATVSFVCERQNLWLCIILDYEAGASLFSGHGTHSVNDSPHSVESG